jgi:hypothetical protein
MSKSNVVNLGEWLRQDLGLPAKIKQAHDELCDLVGLPAAPKTGREMTPAEARQAVREGRLKRRSLKDLDQVIEEIGSRLSPEWKAKLDAIIKGDDK